MKLVDLSSNQGITPLKNLLDNTGSCIMNGFLGNDLSDYYYDDEGLFNYKTENSHEDTSIESYGVFYPDGLLVKQIQKNHGNSLYHLYSWDVNECNYTFLSFDNKDSLNQSFEVIKRFQTNLCSDDITHLFQDMGLDFEHVDRILINQSTNPMSQMFDDYFTKSEKERSFHL